MLRPMRAIGGGPTRPLWIELVMRSRQNVECEWGNAQSWRSVVGRVSLSNCSYRALCSCVLEASFRQQGAAFFPILVRADQTLDMAAEAGLGGWSPFDRRCRRLGTLSSERPVRKSGPLSTCTMSGRPATGHGSVISRSRSHADLSKTECNGHRLVDSLDGASIVR